MDVIGVLVLLVLLQVKHMLADFYLQTPAMLMNRAEIWHPGRASHCFVHIVGTAFCFLVAGVSWQIALALLLAEFVLHYAIDLGKGRWSERLGHTPADASYWRAFGVDQMLHQLTYVAMLVSFVAL